MMRRKQFGHRLTKYKRLGHTRKKFDIGTANRVKRGEKLQEKRNAKWLFTSLSQSTPKTKEKAKEEVSFESISDLEGSYRQNKSPQSTSSSSPEQSSDESAEGNNTLLTPSAAKLLPRPARLQPNTGEPVYQNVDEGRREVRNMLSQWQAQQRAEALATELNEEENKQTNKPESD